MKTQEIARHGDNSGKTAESKNPRHKTGLLKFGVSLCLCLVFFVGMLLHNNAEASPFDKKDEDDEPQYASMDPSRPGAGYSAILYHAQNGLPTSEANAIVQTKDGFIWIGCYSGLIRYDGNVFERMDSTTGIASVISLFVDSKERLWVGTNDSGAFVIEKGQVRTFRHEDGLKSLSVRAITEDAEGNVYLATTQGVVIVDPSMNTHNVENPLIADAFIRAMKADKNGLVYGLTQNGNLFTLKFDKIIVYYNLETEKMPGVISIYPDPDDADYIYLGTDSNEVFRLDMAASFRRFRMIDVAPLNKINSILSIDGVLWFCANNGIGIMENGKLRILDNVKMNNSVEQMMADYQNNLWFVSSHQGVLKITANRFADVFSWYNLDDSDMQTVVNATCSYDNLMLFGTNDGLIVVSEEKQITEWGIREVKTASGDIIRKKDLIEMLQNVRIRSIMRDSRNRIWISTYSDYGLICYELGIVTCYTKADGMPSNRIRCVKETSAGYYWVACTGGVVIMDNENNIRKIYKEDDGIYNTEILTLEEAANGDLIIGTDGGGIFILGASAMKTINTSNGLTSDVVMRVKKDPYRNLYWIVTSNAIAYMDSSYNVTVIRNFPYANNFDLYENSKGEMWILASNGIYVAKVDELLQNEEIHPLFYNWKNGLPYVATSNSYSELKSNGDLYIAGTGGVTSVNIEEEYENVTDLKAALPYVIVDGKEIYPDEKGVIRIQADAKKVVIPCFIFTYSLTNPKVTFWLDGFDNTKTTVDRADLSSVSYTNLHGKTYYFRMEIKDTAGQQIKTISIKIIKNKMFYEFWWFQALAFVIGTLVVAWVISALVHRKIRKIIEKEEEQKIFINEMIEAFAKTIDMKDNYTNGHSFRVAKYTAMLAEELGYKEEDIEKYHNIALLHDIGKIGVEDKVLKKEGKLEDDEFMQIKSHASRGYEVLKDISIMPELAIGAGAHHERPDGKGYPNGLKGDEIPRVAQIIAVADCFDAMYSDRPYRKRMNFEKAVSIIKGAAGTQLTADVVDAFLRLVDKGEFRAPDDVGGGTVEDIDNIHKREAEEDRLKKEAEKKAKEEAAGKTEETSGKPEETAQADKKTE